MIDGAVSGPWSEIARFDIMCVSGGVAASEERDADGAQAQAAQDTYALVMARVLQVSSQGYIQDTLEHAGSAASRTP